MTDIRLQAKNFPQVKTLINGIVQLPCYHRQIRYRLYRDGLARQYVYREVTGRPAPDDYSCGQRGIRIRCSIIGGQGADWLQS